VDTGSLAVVTGGFLGPLHEGPGVMAANAPPPPREQVMQGGRMVPIGPLISLPPRPR